MQDKYLLFTPGPVSVSPEVLKALAEPIMHHRTSLFEEVFSSLLKNLQLIFETSNDVLVLASSGTGAMEAAVVNTLSPGDQILIVDGGKFGQRWTELARRFGLAPVVISVPWGQAVDPEEVNRNLHQFPKIKAVFCQACETSTGVEHPIEDIGSVVKNHGETLFVVDGVSAVGAVRLPMDQWGIDVLVSASQKGLCGPTGLGLISLSEKAWTFSQSAKLNRYYFDLAAERKKNQERQTHFSSAATLIKALDTSLKEIMLHGIEARFARIKRLATATRESFCLLGFSEFPQRPSAALSTLQMNQSKVDLETVRKQLQKQSVFVAGGQDILKSKVLRISHMGYLQNEDLLYLIQKMAQALEHLGYGIPPSKVSEALNQAKNILHG